MPEWRKDPPRRRHIAEPLVNNWFTDTRTIHFRSRQERHQIIRVFGGGFAAILFDQIGLSEAVRPFFGVRYGDRASRMRVLPMGFRPSAQIAEVITWLLVSGLESDRILTYIDNILILAKTKADVEYIRSLIISRAASIGAVFNPEGLTDTPSQRFEILGEAFDLFTPVPTVSLSSKTINKLAMLDEGFTGQAMTRRQLASRRVPAYWKMTYRYSGDSTRCDITEKEYRSHQATPVAERFLRATVLFVGKVF